MQKIAIGLVAVTALILQVGTISHAADQQPGDGHAAAAAVLAKSEGSGEAPADSKANSGATAAEEARIYTARLRRCESLGGGEREACVGAAKRRLGQL